MEPPHATVPVTPMKALFLKQQRRSLSLRAEGEHERISRLRKLENWIEKNRERIKAAVHADFKKPLLEVDTTEIYPVLTEMRHTLQYLHSWMLPKRVDATMAYLGTRSEIRYEPKGVCLIIAPWNFPFNLCVGPLISCLAAGNTAVIKPSEMTPATSRLIKEMVKELFEESVVAVVEGGVEVSQELLSLSFDHIFFTGSPSVGKLVMKAAAEHLSSVTLELGGKSPTVVDASANLSDAACRIAFGKFMNNGQTCIAPDYLLVEETVQDKFIELLKKEIQKLFGEGKPIDEKASSYARIINRKHFHRINALVEDAVMFGAKADRLGSMNEEDNFLAPVLLTNVSPSAAILEEEIFGPVLPILTYTNREEVVDFINQRPKPLALYIFTKRRAFREYIIQCTSAGGVCVNECLLQFTHPNLPFGGVNNSGVGKSHGYFGFLAFSNEKPVLKQKGGWAGPYLLHPPYSTRMKRVVDILLKWF